MGDVPTTSGLAIDGRGNPPPDCTDDLLARIREGDRKAAAEFLFASEGFIRRRFRQRMTQKNRRLLDSQDLLSTIARRFDACVERKGVRAGSEGQLWALIFQIGDNALIERTRVLARLERVEGPDSEIAREWRCRLARAERSQPDGAMFEINRMIGLLPQEIDRRILMLWLGGFDHPEIAADVGLTAANVRQRWVRLCARLRGCLEAEDVRPC